MDDFDGLKCSLSPETRTKARRWRQIRDFCSVNGLVNGFPLRFGYDVAVTSNACNDYEHIFILVGGKHWNLLGCLCHSCVSACSRVCHLIRFNNENCHHYKSTHKEDIKAKNSNRKWREKTGKSTGSGENPKKKKPPPVFACDVNATYARSMLKRRRRNGSANDDKFVRSYAIYNGIHSIQQLNSYILNGINKMPRDDASRGKNATKNTKFAAVFRCSIFYVYCRILQGEKERMPTALQWRINTTHVSCHTIRHPLCNAITMSPSCSRIVAFHSVFVKIDDDAFGK